MKRYLLLYPLKSPLNTSFRNICQEEMEDIQAHVLPRNILAAFDEINNFTL